MKITSLQNNSTLAAVTSAPTVAAPAANSRAEGGVINIRQLSPTELSELREYAQRIESDFDALSPTVKPMPPKAEPLGETAGTGEDDLAPRSGPEMTPLRAAEILLKNLKFLDTANGSKDGVFGYLDLKALGDSPLLSTELKAAVQYLLNNPAVFRAFDVAGEKEGARLDGKISAADLEAYLANNDEKGWGEAPAEWTPETVAETLLKYFSLFDTAAGTDTQGGPLILPSAASKGAGISLLDLGAMINGNLNLPEDLKKAAELLKSSPAVFNALETAVSAKDGKITKKDLQAFLGQDVGPDEPEVDPPNVDPDQKEWTPRRVAEVFLKNFDRLDVGDSPVLPYPFQVGPIKDGLFSPSSLKRVLSSMGSLIGPMSEELRELKQAIEYALRNPMVLNAFDVGNAKGHKLDDKVTRADLEAFLKENSGDGWDSPAIPREQQTVKSAAGVLMRYFNLLDTAAGVGKRDGLIGRGDLEAALKNADLPEELRTVIDYLCTNSAAFDLLDSANAKKGKKDGLIGWGDLEKIANG